MIQSVPMEDLVIPVPDSAMKQNPNGIPMHIHAFGHYINGALQALLKIDEYLECYAKPADKIYMRAIVKLAMSDVRNAERFLRDDAIGFRNHKKKGTKLVSVEAYFIEDAHANHNKSLQTI